MDQWGRLSVSEPARPGARRSAASAESKARLFMSYNVTKIFKQQNRDRLNLSQGSHGPTKRTASSLLPAAKASLRSAAVHLARPAVPSRPR